ncbi:MAG: T9SS type A sorting domain-containing protein [Bacteroidia bacterium]
MKLVFTLASLFSVTVVSAQISITQSDMPSVGDTLRVSYASSTANVNHTLTGTNFLWDFSALTPNAQQVFEFANPTALPFLFTATYGVLNPSPDSLPGIGAVPTNFTDYFKNGSSGYRQVGSSFDYPPIGSFSIPIIYTSSDYVYEFPLNYGDVDSSDAAYSFQLPNLIYLGQDRHRETTVDGWGTLITPFGTFQTLRLRSVVDAVDTVAFDSLGIGFTTPRPQLIEYKWLAQGSKIPVLEVEAQVFASTETVTNVIYRDSVRANVFQVGIAEQPGNSGTAALFPNPCAGITSLVWTQQSPARTTMRITDIQGRVVLEQDFGIVQPGTQTRSVDASLLSSGIYIVRLLSNGLPAASTYLVKQ